MTRILPAYRLSLGVLAAAAAWPVSADDGLRPAAEPAPAIAVADGSRPHAAGDALSWLDHDLAAICAAVSGRFAKLPDSAVYTCAPGE